MAKLIAHNAVGKPVHRDVPALVVTDTSRGKDADNRVGRRIEEDLAPNNILRLPELISPEFIAQNGNAWFAHLVFIGSKSTSHGGTYAENIEIGGRNLGCPQLYRLSGT